MFTDLDNKENTKQKIFIFFAQKSGFSAQSTCWVIAFRQRVKERKEMERKIKWKIRGLSQHRVKEENIWSTGSKNMANVNGFKFMAQRDIFIEMEIRWWVSADICVEIEAGCEWFFYDIRLLTFRFNDLRFLWFFFLFEKENEDWWWMTWIQKNWKKKSENFSIKLTYLVLRKHL